MIYDWKNREVRYSNPGERIEWENHHAQYGPGTNNGPHPDDCPYCKARGWLTFADKSFDQMCDEWAAAHPEAFEEDENEEVQE